jgi:hypothetical protein
MHKLLLLLAVFLSASCSTISKFDQYAYTQATSIKVDALGLMDSATNDYQQYKGSVAGMLNSIDKIYEYEKNRPKNAISEKMWSMMRDSTGHLYGGFIRRWQKEGKLDQAFIQESKKIISKSFDQISQLESGKIKPAQATN